MLPLVGVFAAATVAGFGATVGHRVARTVVLPLADRGAAEVKDWWAGLHRRDGATAPEDGPDEPESQPDAGDEAPSDV